MTNHACPHPPEVLLKSGLISRAGQQELAEQAWEDLKDTAERKNSNCRMMPS